jgi:hypothetical protein
MKKICLKYKSLVSIVIVVLLFQASIAYSATFFKQETKFLTGTFAVEHLLSPFTLAFTMNLTGIYDLDGSYMHVFDHRNDGVLKNYYGYPFSWVVNPNWFRYSENGNVVYSFTSFRSDYDRMYSPSDKPWGGRNTSSAWFYLPGNVHGMKTRAAYYSSATTPSSWVYYVTYGQY